MPLLTGPWKYIKSPQLTVETVDGTLPLAATVFTSCGIITDFDPNISVDNAKRRKLGKRTIHSQTKLGEEYAFSMKYAPLNSTLMKYGVNTVPNTGSIANTAAEPLSILYSALIDGVEKFKVITGVHTDSITVEVSREGGVNVTQNFICKNITNWGTEPVFTGGGAVYAAEPTGDAWSGITSGVDPLKIATVPYDTPSFSMTVNHNTKSMKINGVVSNKYREPTIEDVSMSFDTVVVNAPDPIVADMITGDDTWPGRTLTYNLTPTIVLTFTSAKPETQSESVSVGGDFSLEKIGLSAVTVVLN